MGGAARRLSSVWCDDHRQFQSMDHGPNVESGFIGEPGGRIIDR
jgi:hypothetical protein